jgi:hypothetical protein
MKTGRMVWCAVDGRSWPSDRAVVVVFVNDRIGNFANGRGVIMGMATDDDYGG